MLVFLSSGIVCDADSDCFYVPARWQDSCHSQSLPALILLHCNGALPVDLDTCRFIADSLGWIMASCHASRNHRDVGLNTSDILKTVRKLLIRYPVDPARVFLFGFSGQGQQALITMLMHPEVIRGTVSVCAPGGALRLASFEGMRQNCAYLVTRKSDWNLQDNLQMYRVFNLRGLPCQIRITAGEHSPGPWQEILAGARWLDIQTRP
ncbi:MAG: hypothetical protein ABIK43_02940 [candidate division WOR-3 bacterium]